MTVSLKAGSGNSPWYTLDVPDQKSEREALLHFADLMEESKLPDGRIVADLSLMQLVVLVSSLFQAAERDQFRVVNNGGPNVGTSKATAAAPAGQEKPATPADPEPAAEVDPVAEVEAEIAEATSKEALRTIHGRNNKLFTDNPQLLKALQARAEAIK